MENIIKVENGVCLSESVTGAQDIRSSDKSDADLSDHLVVMVHGIVGSASDWHFAAQKFVRRFPDKVFVHCSARNEVMLTLDGVDVMGERLALEVIDIIERKPNLHKISFVAHSAGGLVARYAIGRLFRPDKNLSFNLGKDKLVGTIAGLEPVNFITVATPHLGSRGNNQVPMFFGLTALEKLAASLVHLIFGKTGRHLFLTDNYDGKPPILKRMVEDFGELHFMSALRSFKRRVAYANIGYDHMVGWGTSSIRRNSELPEWDDPVNGKYPHLFRKKKTPPIPWFDRFRIAWEIASALFFLHNSTPQPILHRDLKPANILLDRNYVSKIGDVGVSKMLNSDSFSTFLNDTALVGTLCYIDPEYQRTGQISVQSDIYAFGIVILQLLTGKAALALTHMAEVAVDDERLEDVLDLEAGCWPIEETKELALLGLKCTELRRRDRPDMKEKVLPVLERLKEIANKAKDAALVAKPVPLNHFICPILKEIMEDPCVAADGYTYDRRAIEKWLQEKDNSPMTNLPLLNKNLIPNYTLLSAINQWNLEKL